MFKIKSFSDNLPAGN